MKLRVVLFLMAFAISAVCYTAVPFPQILFIRDPNAESSSSAEQNSEQAPERTSKGCLVQEELEQWQRFQVSLDYAVTNANDTLLCYKGFRANCELKIYNDTVRIRVTYRHPGEFEMIMSDGLATIRERHPRCDKAKLEELCKSYKYDLNKSKVECSGPVITYIFTGGYKCIDGESFAKHMDIKEACDYWIAARGLHPLEHVIDLEEKR